MDLFGWAAVVAILLLILYKLGTWNHKFFSSKGVKSCRALPFLGSMGSIAFSRRSAAYVLDDIFKKFPEERYVGFFLFRSPVLIIKDPELLKRITVKDFEHFVDHRQQVTEDADPLFAKSLSVLTGERWHAMRATLSPVFTSSKMKNMFHLMNQCGKQVADYLQEEIKKDGAGKPLTVDVKDLFTRFTNDVIATSAFGIHIDSLKEKENHFYCMGKQITNFQGIKSLIFLGFMLAPKVMEAVGIRFFTNKERDFFFDLVRQTISAREKEGIVRHDMIHLLMQARKGELKGDGEGDDGVYNAKKSNLSEEDIVAQAMIFFFAGFETASILLSFTTVLLALNEDVQRKLQDEVDEALGDDQELTYENVQKMKYLDMVISESLRIFPPAIFTDRQCTKDYVIQSADGEPEYTVKKGEGIWIPVYSIQHNPQYFPNPEKFDPERFSDENKRNIQPYTYIPFGSGPRICIGQRFALLEAKVALIHIMAHFNVTVVDKTPLPLKITKKSFVMAPEGGFWVGFTPRHNTAT